MAETVFTAQGLTKTYTSGEVQVLVFTAQGLTKTYTCGEVQVLALQGVDLEVSAGEVVVLLGAVG